jgi:hypothetical protein
MKYGDTRLQMTQHGVMDLLDACCVFVYVQAQTKKIFGMVVMKQVRGLWLQGLGY